MFLAPVNLYDGGISGTSMLLWQMTPEQYTLSLFLVILNVPLFLFGLRKQGWCFTLYSIWTVVIYSAASYLITNVLPVDVSHASPFAGQDLLLCAIFGGLVSGAGSGLTIRLGGAIDGMEVLGVTFAKQLGLTVGSFVMIYNVLLYLAIGVLFHSWILPLYSIIAYFVGNKTIDFIVEGLDKVKSVSIITTREADICQALSEEFGRGITIIAYFVGNKTIDFIVEGLDKVKSVSIITTREADICQALSEEFGRGITQIPATGFFSGESKCMVYFVVNRFQIPKVKRLVNQIDPTAFITVTEISDVMGTSLK